MSFGWILDRLRGSSGDEFWLGKPVGKASRKCLRKNDTGGGGDRPQDFCGRRLGGVTGGVGRGFYPLPEREKGEKKKANGSTRHEAQGLGGFSIANLELRI